MEQLKEVGGATDWTSQSWSLSKARGESKEKTNRRQPIHINEIIWMSQIRKTSNVQEDSRSGRTDGSRAIEAVEVGGRPTKALGADKPTKEVEECETRWV